ncbi:UBC-like protein [Aaosphaeria arxii CBS 175.79]|uniref:UBC-like protein n=1 Tax=Aaosphaeria arxii CBS 175.79 TaxID=1450172 RepID=A0A6A5Y1T3_9PLEO|nr:UBC-like protein [Aaosphaeria arxii CBS 175.79]KAF2019027.1 UBC-like protein [Aaosphaeria arxii CBS 175.79]
MRRIAADVGSLHRAGLPPNYLFPPNASDADLTSLDVLLAGPPGTPYATGVWRLHLEIPPTYPTAPPTATFLTRLWHPNIDEATGAVCVETLKRDWSSSLKLRDVLVTISCLLIQPNPASALNEAAGKLASEDWDGFCRRAKLMTDIHAAVPRDLVGEVREAQMRGEDVEIVAVKEAASSAVAKVQQSSAEDEENKRRRGVTAEVESDPESDWIPSLGNVKASEGFTAGVDSRDNIFGIKGLDDPMQLDSPPKRTVSSGVKEDVQQKENGDDDSDPFITTSPKQDTQLSFELYVPRPSSSFSRTKSSGISTDDWESHVRPNSYLATPSGEQLRSLVEEFSLPWHESQILHGSGSIKNGTPRAEVRKRMAGEEYESRRSWEMKKFKGTGYDLAKYNRGDFGPRTGIGRL